MTHYGRSGATEDHLWALRQHRVTAGKFQEDSHCTRHRSASYRAEESLPLYPLSQLQVPLAGKLVPQISQRRLQALRAGIVEAVQPSLPATPQLTGNQAREPKSSPAAQQATSVPRQANAAVQEVQKGADQAVEAAPGQVLKLQCQAIRTPQLPLCATSSSVFAGHCQGL